MNDSYDQRSKVLVSGKASEMSIMIAESRLVGPLGVILRRVTVGMTVNPIAMDMGMGAVQCNCTRRSGWNGHGAERASDVYESQNNQHQPYQEFHAEAGTRWDHKVQQNDGGADDQDCRCTAYAPLQMTWSGSVA